MGVIYAATIPLDLYVRDFEIYNDLAYFCGYRDIGGQKYGMIGYFRINKFCDPLKKDVYVYDNILFVSSGTTVYSKEFTDLEVYDKYANAGDSTYLVAIGKDMYDRYLVLNAIGEYDNPSDWRYSLGYNKNDGAKETGEQISVTKHYIVTSGTIYNDYNNGMSLRVFDKFGLHDIFSNPSIHNNVYRYPTDINSIPPTPAVHYPIDKNFQMTAIYNDSIATLSLYKLYTGGTPPVTYYGFLLNVYDIAQTITGTNIPCTRSMCTPQSYYYGNIYDLRYDDNKQKILAALTADVPSWGPQSVCAMIPYSLTYPFSFDYYYPPFGYDFNKVVLSNNGNTYLSSSYLSGSGFVGYYRYPVGTAPLCTTVGQETCIYPGELVSKEDYEALKIYRKKRFHFNAETMTCVEEALRKSCRPKN